LNITPTAPKRDASSSESNQSLHLLALQRGPAGDIAVGQENYAGPVEFGEDSMTIDIGNDVTVHKNLPPR
jgi:hypothetical protein